MYMRTGSVVRPKSNPRWSARLRLRPRRHRRWTRPARFAHQQRFSVGSLVIDRDAHVAEGADDAVDGPGVDQVVRQMVADFAVGQVRSLPSLISCFEAVAASYSSADTGPRAIRSLGSALPRFAAALGRLQVGRTSPSPSIGSSKPSESLLAFLAGRQDGGRWGRARAAPPGRPACPRPLGAGLGGLLGLIRRGGLGGLLDGRLRSGLATFTAVLAGAFPPPC